MTANEKEKVEKLLAGGGKMIMMGKAGLDREKENFIFDIGADYIGEASADIDYTIAGDKLMTDLFKAPFL